ncbi:MAG: diadenylate cyclase CdaA [Oscillospiraceae bacterium]|nr:diadenylate cyclase CdaA [Oscillospiraceae bacterium]MBQ6901954.1 diadenylate cyclase CdaA [Oscillospiraceae bacterium]
MDVIGQIGRYLTLFGIWDAVDILIVAYIVYKLIAFSRRTNAGQVIKGIVLLLLIAQVSSLLGLNLLNYLLVNTMQLGLLALVVLFQPELRKAFERFGVKLFSQFSFDRTEDVSELEHAILQTVDACKNLSWSRTGALIVFERELLLDNIIRTGTALDSKVTSELLKNIFYPKAPLHDGALIIQKGRIAAAGCMLPLSGNTSLSKQLGMRHRAGVGMSENSDAVVVVVSEETGSVSVAIGGMLKRHLAPETLEKLLRNELMPKSEESKRNNVFTYFFTHKKVNRNEE